MRDTMYQVFIDGNLSASYASFSEAEDALSQMKLEGVPGMLSMSIPAPAAIPEPVPQVLTMRQAKLVLLKHGLLEEVNNAVSRADEETRIEWEYATEVRRDWPTLSVIAAELNIDDGLLDSLFIEGAKL